MLMALCKFLTMWEGQLQTGNTLLVEMLLLEVILIADGSVFSFSGTVANNNMSGTWGSASKVNMGKMGDD